MSKKMKVALVAIAAVAVVFCVGSYALDRQLLNDTYARYMSEEPSFMLTDADVAADYPSESVEFQLDGYTLRGHVYAADNARGLVVFRHGIFSQHQDYLALITALVDRGWTVFAYDAIGCGESDGDSVLGFAQSPIDVHAAVQFARESGMADGLPILLFGHSWGGYGVAGALDYDDGVAACVTMSGFDTPTGIIMESAVNRVGFLANVELPFIELIGHLDFGADADRSAAHAIEVSGVPTLVVHGTQDAVVSYDNASIMSKLKDSSLPNVTFLTMSEEGRNGHNTYFYSPESQAYLAECVERSESVDKIDKRRANTADPALMDEIDAFFTQSLVR